MDTDITVEIRTGGGGRAGRIRLPVYDIPSSVLFQQCYWASYAFGLETSEEGCPICKGEWPPNYHYYLPIEIDEQL